jgi:hypothetical protein
MGRTIPSWRIVVEEELAKMDRFKQFLRTEDRAVFEDLLNQCKLYAPQAGTLASPVNEVPLLLSMIFAQHKKFVELEKAFPVAVQTATPTPSCSEGLLTIHMSKRRHETMEHSCRVPKLRRQRG